MDLEGDKQIQEVSFPTKKNLTKLMNVDSADISPTAYQIVLAMQ